jgi:MFS family permease
VSSGRTWLRLDVIGVLTVIVYGTWFYGFGVLFEDLADFQKVSAGTLGITYGAANLLAGAGAIATGRRLDTIGPRAVLGVVGPLGAVVYGASASLTGTTFLVAYAIGGGLMGAAGFYSFTQPLSVRVVDTDAARAITRLTIWGAFSSPIMIPLTEVLRANYGWQTAIRIPALLTVLAFVLCAAVSKPRTASVATTQTLGSTLLLAARDWRLRRFTLAAFLSGVAASTLLVFQVPTMTWAGVSTSVAAGLASARGLMQLAGRLPLMAAMKRFGAPRLMIASRALLGVAALLLLGSGQWAVAVLYVAIAGITIGALSALDGVVARSVIGAQNFGAVMGGIGLLSTLGGSSGPILGGQLRDWSGSPVASMMLVAATAWLATVVFASLGLARQDSATS